MDNYKCFVSNGPNKICGFLKILFFKGPITVDFLKKIFSKEQRTSKLEFLNIFLKEPTNVDF